MKRAKVEELAQHLNLVKFHTYELAATARDEYELADAESNGPDADEPELGDEQVRVHTGIRRRPGGLDYRVEFLFNHHAGQVLADIGAFYECDPSLDLETASDEVLIEFGDRVALMALYPYLRQAISDLGQRVGVRFTLPMLRSGDLSFAPAEAEDPEV